ncbi:hypothetical protein [Tolypothrix sp. VBCCA 56010]|uniref:hypothetical protein n=1 Tax=Tolypothrix sp. VBCCA 56010 TaxID=3137731 RepID=UPI003D7D9C23
MTRRRAFLAPTYRKSPDYLQVGFLRAIAPESFPSVGEKSVIGLRVTRDRKTR